MSAKWLSAQSYYKSSNLLHAINDLVIGLKLQAAGRATQAHLAALDTARETLRRFVTKVQTLGTVQRTRGVALGYDPRAEDLFATVLKKSEVEDLKNLLAGDWQAEQTRDRLIARLEELRPLVAEHQREDESALFGDSC
jgi:hypothetical protein